LSTPHPGPSSPQRVAIPTELQRPTKMLIRQDTLVYSLQARSLFRLRREKLVTLLLLFATSKCNKSHTDL